MAEKEPAAATEPQETTPSAKVEAAPAAAPVSTPAAQPVAEQIVQMNDTIQYQDSSGQTVETTVQELTDAKDKLSSLGDLDGLKDMIGFMKGEPDAQKRILESQIEQLAPTPTPDPQADYVKQLEGRLAEVEGRLKPMERLVSQSDIAEDGAYVSAMLGVDKVKEAFPTLALKPDIAQKILQPQFTRLKQMAKQQGVDLSQRNDLVAQLLQKAESEIKNLLTAYGLPTPDPSATEQPANGRQQPPIVPQQAPIVPQVPVIPGVMPQVPQSGGVPGTPVAANQQGATGPERITRQGILDKLKATRQSSGATP